MEALGSAISDPETTNAAWEAFRENTPANPLDWVSWLYAVGGALAAGGAVATKKFLEKKKNGSDPVN